MALPDDVPGTSLEVTRFLIDQLGLRDGDQVFVDGFLVGDEADLTLAVRGVTTAPIHRGILLYEGSHAFLRKPVGTRQLRRFGNPVLAREMLRACGKQHQQPIEVIGMEAVSSSFIPSIEISAVVGCNTGGGVAGGLT